MTDLNKQMENIVQYISENGYISRQEGDELLKENSTAGREIELIENLLEYAIANRNIELMHFVHLAREAQHIKEVRRFLDFEIKFIQQFWSSGIEDGVGNFQFYKKPDFAAQLYEIGMKSLSSAEERHDENHQFFRKITWALGETSTREFFVEKKSIGYLLEMAKVDIKVAAYWAKKQLNHRLKEKSPYANEDLSVMPDE